MGGQCRIFAQIDFPFVFPGVEIDGIERAPRWSDGRIALGNEKSAVTGETVFHPGRPRLGTGEFRVLAGEEEIHQPVELVFIQIREGGHSALTGLNRQRDVGGAEAIADCD